MQRVAHGITKVEVIALLCLHFIMQTLLPFINLIFLKEQVAGISICGDFSVPFVMEKILFFPLVGYYIEYNIDIAKIKARHILGLIIVGCIGIGLSIYSTFLNASIINDYTQDYIDLCNYIIAIVVFIIIKYVFVIALPSLENGKIGNVIDYIGTMTLGIYMFDPCFKVLFGQIFDQTIAIRVSHFGASVLWILMSFGLGMLITCILKKIPLLGKII